MNRKISNAFFVVFSIISIVFICSCSLNKNTHTHEFSSNWLSNETNHWRECECGEKSEDSLHTFGEWVTVTLSTEKDTGLKKRECSVCGYEEEAEIPVLSHTHNFESSWKYDATGHWHECSCGEHGDEAEHTYGEWIIITSATETTVGLKKRECSVCGYEEEAEIPVLPHTHKFSTKWNYNETTHWHECECGEKSDEKEHQFGDWNIITAATNSTSGLREKVCECGYKYQEEIPAHEHIFENGVCTICGFTNIFTYTILSNTTCKLDAYNGDKTISKLEIPKSINGYQVVEIKKGILEDCESLTEITIPFVGQKIDASGNTMFEWIFGAEFTFESGQYASEKLATVIVTGGQKIKEKAFVSEHITKLILHDYIVEIENGAINCTNLRSIE